jgi:hypothetical protein
VGAGHVASFAHVPVFRRLPGLTLNTICNRDEQKEQRVTHPDFRQLMGAPRVTKAYDSGGLEVFNVQSIARGTRGATGGRWNLDGATR